MLSSNAAKRTRAYASKTARNYQILALGYIPKIWRLIGATIIPKIGKTGQAMAKALRPISLVLFILITIKKLLDRHIRDVSSANR